MSDFYKQIAQHALVVAGGTVHRFLLYSEVEDGVISADIFYQLPRDAVVRYRFASTTLRDLIYEFWESGGENIVARSWATMRLKIETNGQFVVDLTYPDQLNPEEGYSDRRPRVIIESFSDAKVDYSMPNG
jgi:hypothetical protein